MLWKVGKFVYRVESRVIVTSEETSIFKMGSVKLNLVNYVRTVRRRLPREYLKEKTKGTTM